MLKTPQEIINEINQSQNTFNDKKASVGLIKGIIDDAKEFFNGLADRVIAVRLPKVQKVKGTISLKEARSLLVGINEVVKNLQQVKTEITSQTKGLSKYLKPSDFSKLEKAIKAIKIPETKIPEYPKDVKINNLKELKNHFDQLADKFNIKIPEVKIPDYPKSIKVSNFPKPKPEPMEEEMIGFSWQKNDLGEVTKITEEYPSGKVISTGWVLGRVKIDDQRK